MSISRMVYTGTSYFGEFARNEIVTEIEKYHFHKALLVSDEGLKACGVVAKVEEVFQKNKIAYDIFTDVKPNPTIENVHAGVGKIKACKADFVVAVGGGSVIDTAKAVCVIANNPDNEDIVSLEGVDKSKNRAVPLIALPTTAGTGSETTMDYVITNTQEKRKMACMDAKVVPVAAILDTDLMTSLPLKMTAATAMDALTHAVESYLSKGAFSFSEMLSLKSVSLVAENFLAVLEHPHDHEVRKQLAIASYMAGMSFTNVGLGIVHSMAHPLSAYYDVPHGVANALILPYIVEFNGTSCKDKMIALATAFDHAFDKKEGADAAIECCVNKIRLFNEKAGLPQVLSEVGVHREDLESLAESAKSDAATPDNPVEVNQEILKGLYEKMYQ